MTVVAAPRRRRTADTNGKPMCKDCGIEIAESFSNHRPKERCDPCRRIHDAKRNFDVEERHRHRNRMNRSFDRNPFEQSELELYPGIKYEFMTREQRVACISRAKEIARERDVWPESLHGDRDAPPQYTLVKDEYTLAYDTKHGLLRSMESRKQTDHSIAPVTLPEVEEDSPTTNEDP